jgi:hypothetical protein
LRGGVNRFGHPLDVGHYVNVAEAEDRKTKALQMVTPSFVFTDVMGVTIDLNCKADSGTEEIHDRMGFSNNMLPPKLESAEMRIREVPPQTLLGFCGVATHLVRSLQKFSF